MGDGLNMPASADATTTVGRWRMVPWLLLTLALMVGALLVQGAQPGSVVAVTLYKGHLMALGGWGGYWLDRALFPYERPHEVAGAETVLAEDAYAAYCFAAGGVTFDGKPLPTFDQLGADRQACWRAAVTANANNLPGTLYDVATIRRALIVLGALLCVGLGA